MNRDFGGRREGEGSRLKSVSVVERAGRLLRDAHGARRYMSFVRIFTQSTLKCRSCRPTVEKVAIVVVGKAFWKIVKNRCYLGSNLEI